MSCIMKNLYAVLAMRVHNLPLSLRKSLPFSCKKAVSGQHLAAVEEPTSTFKPRPRASQADPDTD